MPENSHNRWLRTIAIFKLIKAILLIVVAVGGFKLLNKDVLATVEHWADLLGLNLGNRVIEALLVKVSRLSPDKIKLLSAGALIYAGLFLTEGTGLLLEKRWAEWLTVIITSSLVPFEIYEIVRHPNAIKVAALVINVAIVAYLIYQIRTQRSSSPRSGPSRESFETP